MRLGKTAQVIRAAEVLDEQAAPDRLRVVVVCPAVARGVWPREMSRWWRRSPLPAEHFAVLSYDEVRSRRPQIPCDLLVLDECQMVKNPRAKRTIAIFGKQGLARMAKRVWALSGTPAPNHVGELWPLLRAFGRTKLDYHAFCEAYCRLDMDGRPKGTKTLKKGEIRAMVKPVLKRRLRRQVAPELPAAQVVPWHVPLSPRFFEYTRFLGHEYIYQEVEEQGDRLLDRLAKKKGDHAAMLQVLQQSKKEFSVLRHHLAIMKAPHIYETIVSEFELNLVDKLVVFGYHRIPMRLLENFLRQVAGLRARTLYGGTNQRWREQCLKWFDKPSSKGGLQVLCLQVLAGGMAIDLSAAHDGIMLERDWSPAVNAQAMERMGGYRQQHPIVIRDAIAEGSEIDRVITDVVNRKVAELSTFLDM